MPLREDYVPNSDTNIHCISSKNVTKTTTLEVNQAQKLPNYQHQQGSNSHPKKIRLHRVSGRLSNSTGPASVRRLQRALENDLLQANMLI